MAITLSGRTISIVPYDGKMNLRDPDGTGDFDPNNPGEIYVNNETIQVDEDVGTAEIPVVRTGGTGAASVDYTTQDGTALAGTSYTSTSGTLSWVDGETGTKRVFVDITDRTGDEQGDLDFSVVISNPSGAPIREKEDGSLMDTTVVTIRDLDSQSEPQATVLWNGDFDDGTPDAWTWNGGSTVPDYGNVPPVGDGSLANIQSSITPGNRPYAAMYHVKNSSDGSEPDDCDGQGSNCTRRRSSFKAHHVLTEFNAIPQFEERWASISIYIPSSGFWDSGSSWGPVLLGFKGSDDSGSGTANLHLDGPGNRWAFHHRWSPGSSTNDPGNWRYNIHFRENFPWGDPEFLFDDAKEFAAVDEATASAAFANVNLDGWTDWVWRMRNDHRGSNEGGTGYLDLYKREDNGSWVHVLHIFPKVMTRGDETFDRGIGFDTSGYWISGHGLYMAKEKVWDSPNGWRIYMANTRIYDAGSTLDGIAGMLR